MNYFVLNINYNGGSEVDYCLNKRKLAPVFRVLILQKYSAAQKAALEAGRQKGGGQGEEFLSARRFPR